MAMKLDVILCQEKIKCDFPKWQIILRNTSENYVIRQKFPVFWFENISYMSLFGISADVINNVIKN